MDWVALYDYDSGSETEAIRVGTGTRVAVYDAETGDDLSDELEVAGTLVYAESDETDGALDALDGAFSTFKDWTRVALVALDL